MSHPDKPNPHTTVHPPAGSHHVHEAAPMHDAPDSWHDHSHDEAPQHAHGEVQNSNLVMGVGIALTLVIVVSCLVVYGFYTHYNTQRANLRERRMTHSADGPVEKTRKDRNEALGHVRDGTTFAIPTDKEGVEKPVTLAPFDSAKDAVARKYSQQFSAPSRK